MISYKEKRKRTKNTSNSQYALYLEYMENDYAFRSDTINPTMEENYLDNKWDELTTKLNSLGDGPSMSLEEWKKRFRDWKNATRSKYRKIVADRNKTRSGPHIKMSNLEKRGLSVWGKVTVTGTPNATLYEGIPTASTSSIAQDEVKIEMITDTDNYTTPLFDSNMDIFMQHSTSNNNTETTNYLTETIETNETIPDDNSLKISNTRITTPVRNRRRRTIPKQKNTQNLCEIAQNIISTNKDVQNSTHDLNATLQTFSENYLRIQKEQLRFEVEKFKYENKDFVFTLDFDK